MELIIRFDCCPSPWGNVADDGLTALVHMNVLDGNLLLSLARCLFSASSNVAYVLDSLFA
jgi:hypothetical protein